MQSCALLRFNAAMRGYLNNLGGLCRRRDRWRSLPLCAARAADLKDARVWAGPEYTRVVLDASGPLHYKISQKDGQVVVDLPDSRVSRRVSPIRPRKACYRA